MANTHITSQTRQRVTNPKLLIKTNINQLGRDAYYNDVQQHHCDKTYKHYLILCQSQEEHEKCLFLNLHYQRLSE